MPSILQLPRKVVGYLLLDNSYDRYYPLQFWDRKYRLGYSLDIPREAGRYQAVISLVRQYAQGGIILDAGCGDGLLEQKGRSLGLSFVGIDYSSAAIASARQRSLRNCEFVCADARSFFSNQRFSAIVFNESLYYIEGCVGFLRAMAPLLDPGGVFIISMYDTRITRRIGNSLQCKFFLVSEVKLKNGVSWTIRVLRPPLLCGDPSRHIEFACARKAFPP